MESERCHVDLLEICFCECEIASDFMTDGRRRALPFKSAPDAIREIVPQSIWNGQTEDDEWFEHFTYMSSVM